MERKQDEGALDHFHVGLLHIWDLGHLPFPLLVPEIETFLSDSYKRFRLSLRFQSSHKGPLEVEEVRKKEN